MHSWLQALLQFVFLSFILINSVTLLLLYSPAFLLSWSQIIFQFACLFSCFLYFFLLWFLTFFPSCMFLLALLLHDLQVSISLLANPSLSYSLTFFHWCTCFLASFHVDIPNLHLPAFLQFAGLHSCNLLACFFHFLHDFLHFSSFIDVLVIDIVENGVTIVLPPRLLEFLLIPCSCRFFNCKPSGIFLGSILHIVLHSSFFLVCFRPLLTYLHVPFLWFAGFLAFCMLAATFLQCKHTFSLLAYFLPY